MMTRLSTLTLSAAALLAGVIAAPAARGYNDMSVRSVSTTELAFERSGPERYLSSLRLIIETIREVGAEPGERAAVTIGRLVAHLATLRQMSLSVAGMLQAGQNPNLEASVVKDVGTSFEQEIPETIHSLLGVEPRLGSGSDFERTLGFLTEHAPSFSLRGGTREVLRGIIARGLGLR